MSWVTTLRSWQWAGLIAAASLIACNSSPEPVKLPDMDPQAAAAAALADYDTDGDGRLSSDELVASPGLAAARKAVDTDGDGQLSADELVARIRLYIRRGAGVKSVFCTVSFDRRALEGATVELIPEPFLGGEVLPARGISAADGSVPLSVDSEALPADLAGIAAVHQGIYRVRITHPDRDLPSRYNRETTLGCEVGPTTRSIDFALTSR